MTDRIETVITDAIWTAWETQEYPMGGPYVDRDMGMIDTSGGAEVDMKRAVEHILAALTAARIAVVELGISGRCSPHLHDQHPNPDANHRGRRVRVRAPRRQGRCGGIPMSASDEIECRWCRELIRPNQTGGWYHVETRQHRADQRCFLYAEPEATP